MSSSKRSIRAVACVAGLGLIFAQAALAVEQPTRFNAADQAAAKAMTLKAADLGPGWTGAAKTPNLKVDTRCGGKSDLILTGVAVTEVTTPGALISSESNVLQSRAMVATEWRRGVGSPVYMGCALGLLKDTAEQKMVSFKKLAFPKLAQYSVRYRMVVDQGKPGSSTRILNDVIYLGQGRSQIWLSVKMRYADRGYTDDLERQVAQILVSRMKA